MELSRRRFMQFLSAAPVALAFDPHRKIFDMGRSKIWTPPPPSLMPHEYLELGPYIDRSIEIMLAQFNEKMEQTVYESIRFEGLVSARGGKSSVQALLRRSELS